MGMTKEQRLKRAREKMKKLREATKTRGRTDRMDWRPKAKIVLHPATDITERQRIWFPKVIDVKEDDGDGKGKRKKASGKTKVVAVPFNVPKDPDLCPFAAFRQLLRERDDIDGEDIVICVGSGRQKSELCKGEILGWDGYDFRKRLTPNSDFVAVAVLIEDSKGKRPADLKAEIFSGAKSLGQDIEKEIESEMDESGEEEGCPFITPYPFIIKYDESERGSDMYSARARPQEAEDIAKDAALMKILEEDPPSIEDEIEIAKTSEMLAAINSAIVIDGLEVKMDGVSSKKEKEEEPEQTEETADESEEQEETADEPKEQEPEKKPAKRTARKPAAKKDPAAKKEPEKKPAKKEPEKEEKPAAKRKPREKKVAAESKKKLGWTPADGEDYDICPVCREAVPQDATECPHPDCDAVYAPSEDEPF